MKMIPVWEHRELVCYVSSEKQAEKKLRAILQHIPKGWKITVNERSDLIRELYGFPPGFVYSVHP
jgi:hypothetical protein